MVRVLITGIAGQDGSYLAEHLLSSGDEVYGIIRRNSTPEHQESRLDHIASSIRTFYGDVLDPASLARVVREVQPDEVYNLAAQSHVRISFDVPQWTVQTNAVGVLNVLDAVRTYASSAQFYQASSSEMFGNSVDEDGMQREMTPMHPTSPYGCAKMFGYNLVRHYRSAYKMFASNGILFNHESPRRGSNFVTNKVVKAATRIKHGLQDKLVLGNMDAQRDWGHSKDYVRAMVSILRHAREPGDYVVATGKTHSVRDLCAYVFKRLGLDYTGYVTTDSKYLRAEELAYLCGDSTKIRDSLGWQPTYTFETLLDEMIDHWMGVWKSRSY